MEALEDDSTLEQLEHAALRPFATFSQHPLTFLRPRLQFEAQSARRVRPQHLAEALKSNSAAQTLRVRSRRPSPYCQHPLTLHFVPSGSLEYCDLDAEGVKHPLRA